MSEFKGTKGKWTFKNESAFLQIDISSGNKKRICEVKSFGSGFNDPNNDEALANAKLIASAPELLEALQMHVDQLDLSNMDFYNKYGFNVGEVMQKTRELLTKATN